jgi:hypothetical protein
MNFTSEFTSVFYKEKFYDEKWKIQFYKYYMEIFWWNFQWNLQVKCYE